MRYARGGAQRGEDGGEDADEGLDDELPDVPLAFVTGQHVGDYLGVRHYVGNRLLDDLCDQFLKNTHNYLFLKLNTN